MPVPAPTLSSPHHVDILIARGRVLRSRAAYDLFSCLSQMVKPIFASNRDDRPARPAIELSPRDQVERQALTWRAG